MLALLTQSPGRPCLWAACGWSPPGLPGGPTALVGGPRDSRLPRETRGRRGITHLRLPPQGYLPANAERRAATLQRKREEYFAFVEHYYDSRNDEGHQDTYRQVGLSSVPRGLRLAGLQAAVFPSVSRWPPLCVLGNGARGNR